MRNTSSAGTSLLLCSLLVLLLVAPLTSFAQVQFESTLGVTSVNNTAYTCAQLVGGGNKIKTISSNGKSRLRGKKSVVRSLLKLRKRTQKRLKTARRALKKEERKLKRLQGKFPPATDNQIRQAQAKIAALQQRNTELSGQVSEIRAMSSLVKTCGKGPSFGNGTNVLQIGTAVLPDSGEQVYAVNAFYVFPVSSGFNEFICADVGGEITKRRPVYSICVNFRDRVSNRNYRECFNDQIPSGFAVVGIAAKAGQFSSGRYDRDLAEVQGALSTAVNLTSPDQNGNC